MQELINIYLNLVINYLNLSEPIKGIEVYNLVGQLMKVETEETYKIDVSDLISGIYLLRSGKSTIKFVVQKIIEPLKFTIQLL